VEKIVLILEPLVKTKKLIISKNELNTNKGNQNVKNNDIIKDINSRGRKINKEKRNSALLDDVEKNKIVNDSSNNYSKRKNNDDKTGEKNRKNKDSSTISDINNNKFRNTEEDIIKSDENENSNIDKDLTNLNIKKKKKKNLKIKTKSDNNLNSHNNNHNGINKHENGNISADRSNISDDNLEKNKMNFFNVLKSVTTNMLLQSKIKGENVECLIEPQVIPNLDELLAESISLTQRNINPKKNNINIFSENNIDKKNLTDEDYDYDKISNNSHIYIKNDNSKNLRKKPTKEIIINYQDNNKKSNRSPSDIERKSNSKINENDVNRSININDLKIEISSKKNKNNNPNNVATDRSGIYRMNENSNFNDLSRENRLEFASTNDKNDSKSGKIINSDKKKPNEKNDKPNIIAITDEKNIKSIKEENNKNIKSEILNNKDIVIKEKINIEVDKNVKSDKINIEKITNNKNTKEEINDVKNKERKNIKDANKKKNDNNNCKCACFIF
jgi:hypothetical protein